MSSNGFGANMPAAEIQISQELVVRLLADQHPDLAELPLTELARGWDNTMYRLGDELTVRLPHRELAEGLLQAEQRWLPTISEALPLPIPTPVRTGVATDYFPWTWSVLRWFDGEPIGITPNLDQSQAAADLGAFLAALHKPANTDAPINTGRGVPLADRHRMTVDRIDALLNSDVLNRGAVMALHDRWERYVALPTWQGPPLWLHADLHALNILQHRRRISAVIDFGDITSGDPATDLAIAFSLFDADDREVFRAAADSDIRPIDDAMWERAEGWAMSVGLTIVSSSADSPLMFAIGRKMIGI